MNSATHLFDRVLERDNLRVAFHKALRGKRGQSDAQAFARQLDTNLARMAEQLRLGTFPVGVSTQFIIHDPKERLITAPCFAERVLHHAIVNVCEPEFERWLIADTFACRTGKGRVAALARAQQFARRHAFFLKLDIRKYFDSIDHAVLRQKLSRCIYDGRLMELLLRIIASHESSSGRGLPIGSLTSQHFANFYLGHMDRFVKETLRVRGYARYMDDMALWGPSAASLHEQLAAITVFLREQLGLELKPTPYINRTAHGMDWLGCRVFPDRLTLNRRSRRRFVRKLRECHEEFAAGHCSELYFQQRVTALVAFTKAGGVRSADFRRRALLPYHADV